jgi:hypothetical protein
MQYMNPLQSTHLFGILSFDLSLSQVFLQIKESVLGYSCFPHCLNWQHQHDEGNLQEELVVAFPHVPSLFPLHSFCWPSHYPLVKTNIAIEHDHRNSGFTHSKWWIFPWLR